MLAGEETSLVELVGAPAATPRQQDHGLRPVAKQASVGGVTQAGLQRQYGVAHRGIAEPVTVFVGQPAQPVDEAAGAMLVDIAQALVGLEVRGGRS